ncbi:hypothetical protein GSI_00650 [Ganoderma sinense ZZ0214-1]|uniref:RING-type domain-containing protein n=1 Tax=Ganoderma sinense ZZ0214-1 TaxID=1077348 RepID=A0A2G8STR1_9APHY|nr:hypothetical protein GSI_00650 [Ganoderma sinense ZZ0214-1]
MTWRRTRSYPESSPPFLFDLPVPHPLVFDGLHGCLTHPLSLLDSASRSACLTILSPFPALNLRNFTRTMEIAELHLTVQERIQLAISRLPALTKADIPVEDSCPICLNPFDAILDGKTREELGEGGPESAGVTKLVGCGHVFCKACLVEWIRGRHGSCPSCRHVFSSVRPPSDSDNESSDGDYVPGDDEEDDEDDGFFDSDGFMDTESEFDDMDVQVNLLGALPGTSEFDGDVDYDAVLWEEQAADVSMEDSNWGLSDGASDSLSEVEGLALSGELPENDDAAVYSDRGETSGVIQAPENRSVQPK